MSSPQTSNCMARAAKTANSMSPAFVLTTVCAMVLLGFFSILTSKATPSKASTIFKSAVSNGNAQIKAMTWNMAAINNNPFEYWISNDDPEYNSLMKEVSDFISHPSADKDLKISKIFTDDMFDELSEKMKAVGWDGVDEVRKIWEEDYRDRKSISGFIKDPVIGKKRLASMPDRVSNTIITVDEGVVTRPTVINCYEGELGSIDAWWKQWSNFVFTKKISVKKEGVVEKTNIYELMSPIRKAKYPDITEHEEKISIPLQTLCLAIFDSILVDMLNQLSPTHWQRIRTDICEHLNKKKTENSLSILEDTYMDHDVAFLQEVSSNLVTQCADRKMSKSFDIVSPNNLDPDRDQNSFILLKKNRFVSYKDETEEVLSMFPEGEQVPIETGDLFVMSAIDSTDGTKYLFASFHGDTNGLATIPVVSAVHDFAATRRKAHKLLFGMDANTYHTPKKDQQGVTEFVDFLGSKHMKSCWIFDDIADYLINYTIYCARTHLQPQLNKAASYAERDKKGDKNPKDFIVFFESDFTVLNTHKDNTGRGTFVDDMVLPTLDFPSDHAITSTTLTSN